MMMDYCSLYSRGTEEYFNLDGKVDIINSTLGKAVGGAAGIFFLNLKSSN